MRKLGLLGMMVAGLAGLAMVPPPPPRGALEELTAPPATAPTIAQVFTSDLLALKTKGKTPKEAFEMLSQKSGVIFTARFLKRNPDGTVTIEPVRNAWGQAVKDSLQDAWETTHYDFDLEGTPFWEAAERLGAMAHVRYFGDRHVMELTPTAESVLNVRMPFAVQDFAAMRVRLYHETGQGLGGPSLALEFVLDPRLAILDWGTLNVEKATDAAGNTLVGKKVAVQYPGNRNGTNTPQTAERAPGGPSQLNLQAVTTGVEFRSGVKTVEELRGYVPVVLGTKLQALEYAVNEGAILDQKEHRIGDWSVKVTSSKSIGDGSTLPNTPDHEIKLEINRLKEDAPPFAKVPWSLVHLEGTTMLNKPLTIVTSADGKHQDWTLQSSTRVGRANTLWTKLIIDVPLEAKAAVLPFEFKKVGVSK